MKIVDWTLNQRGATRAAAIFALTGASAFVLFVAIGSVMLLPSGATLAEVFARAVGWHGVGVEPPLTADLEWDVSAESP